MHINEPPCYILSIILLFLVRDLNDVCKFARFIDHPNNQCQQSLPICRSGLCGLIVSFSRCFFAEINVSKCLNCGLFDFREIFKMSKVGNSKELFSVPKNCSDLTSFCHRDQNLMIIERFVFFLFFTTSIGICLRSRFF